MPFIDDHANGAGRGIILIYYIIDYNAYYIIFIKKYPQ